MEEIGLLEQGNMPNDGECLQGRFRVKSNFSQRYNKNLSYYIGQPWKKYSSILLVKGESLGGQRTMEHQQLQSDKWTLPGGTTISWRSYGRTGRSDWELGYQILKEQCDEFCVFGTLVRNVSTKQLFLIYICWQWISLKYVREFYAVCGRNGTRRSC